MGNSPGQTITIPDNEVIRDEDVQREGQSGGQPQQPSWASRAWDKTKNVLGLNEGFLFGGSGEAAGVGGAPRNLGEAVTPFTYPVAEFGGEVAAPYIGKALGAAGRMLPSWGKEAGPEVWRDATHLNKVPFAGEGESPSFMERDATRLNAPYAGEDFAPTPWRDATRENVAFAGETEPGGAPIRTTPYSKRPAASFDIPSTVPERESLPGAGKEGFSMLRKDTPELQQAVADGDPKALEVWRRLHPTEPPPIVIPKEAQFPSSRRLGGTFEERMNPSWESVRQAAEPSWQQSATPTPISSPTASQGPSGGLPQGRPNLFEIASPMEESPKYAGPEQRDLSLEGRTRRQMFEEQHPGGRTPGEELEATMRQSGNQPPQFTEGQVTAEVTKKGISDPQWYQQYKNANPRIQTQMVMDLIGEMEKR
jgi:hypothetical protein